jgi:dihydroflavonol-4-reductase
MSDEVFLTGATGFVGGHVLEALQRDGYSVRALVRPGAPPLGGVERTVVGDLRRPGELVAAMRGCRYLVHVAALYSFTPSDRAALREVNVQGTAGILEAAALAGVEKAVVTSSAATLGPAGPARPADEEAWPPPPERPRGYHDSKKAQERAALAVQIPVVLLLPTAPVGPRDWRPTPTGQMILDFMRGRIFAGVSGGMNLVSVEDVARAHVLALAWGRPGERYVAGGQDLSFDAIWELLARSAGRGVPRFRLPGWAPEAIATVDELRCRLIRGARPVAPVEGARLAGRLMYASSDKARRELSYEPGPVSDAVHRAVRWYRDNGRAA